MKRVIGDDTMTTNHKQKYNELVDSIHTLIKQQTVVMKDLKNQMAEENVSPKREAYYLGSKAMLNKFKTLLMEIR